MRIGLLEYRFGHQAAQLSQCPHLLQQSALGRHAQPLLDCGGQLHAPQAVEVQVFAQAQFISGARRLFAGDL